MGDKVPYGFTVGNHWYAQCSDCGKIVRVNKPLLGSAHFCLSDEEREARALLLRQQQREREVQRPYQQRPYPLELKKAGKL